MGSLGPHALQFLEGEVKAIVQEGTACTNLEELIDRLIDRSPMISRAYFENDKTQLADLWMKSMAQNQAQYRDNPELPPSPPESATNGRHRDSNVSSIGESLASEEREMIPMEDPENTARVSITIHDDKTDTWGGMRGCYGTGKKTFIAQHIVERHKLSVKDGRVHLTWFSGDELSTYRIFFVVVPSEKLSGDCLLGKDCRKNDEGNEEQHEDDERNSEGSQARSEPAVDTSLCRISPLGFPPQSNGDFDTLARMNALSNLTTFMHISSGPPHRTLGNGG